MKVSCSFKAFFLDLVWLVKALSCFGQASKDVAVVAIIETSFSDTEFIIVWKISLSWSIQWHEEWVDLDYHMRVLKVVIDFPIVFDSLFLLGFRFVNKPEQIRVNQ